MKKFLMVLLSLMLVVGLGLFGCKGGGAGDNDDNDQNGYGTVAVTGVTLPASRAIEVGESVTLTPVIEPANATNKNVTWEVLSGSDKITFANGVVTGVAEGAAEVEVYTEDGAFTALTKITVIPAGSVRVTSVTLDETTLSLQEGETATLTATIEPAEATVQTGDWTSSAPAIATVTASGVVTAVAPGTATITFTTTDSGFTASCAVTVTAYPVFLEDDETLNLDYTKLAIGGLTTFDNSRLIAALMAAGEYDYLEIYFTHSGNGGSATVGRMGESGTTFDIRGDVVNLIEPPAGWNNSSGIEVNGKVTRTSAEFKAIITANENVLSFNIYWVNSNDETLGPRGTITAVKLIRGSTPVELCEWCGHLEAECVCVPCSICSGFQEACTCPLHYITNAIRIGPADATGNGGLPLGNPSSGSSTTAADNRSATLDADVVAALNAIVASESALPNHEKSFIRIYFKRDGNSSNTVGYISKDGSNAAASVNAGNPMTLTIHRSNWSSGGETPTGFQDLLLADFMDIINAGTERNFTFRSFNSFRIVSIVVYANADAPANKKLPKQSATHGNGLIVRFVPHTNCECCDAFPTITITTQPGSPTVQQGSITQSLTVVAAIANSSSTLSYQWYSNTTASNTGGLLIAGASSDEYAIPTDLTEADGDGGKYYYYVVVSATDAPSVTSNVATVTVSNFVLPAQGVIWTLSDWAAANPDVTEFTTTTLGTYGPLKLNGTIPTNNYFTRNADDTFDLFMVAAGSGALEIAIGPGYLDLKSDSRNYKITVTGKSKGTAGTGSFGSGGRLDFNIQPGSGNVKQNALGAGGLTAPDMPFSIYYDVPDITPTATTLVRLTVSSGYANTIWTIEEIEVEDLGPRE